MVRDLLLEIGVEELPSAYMRNTIEQLDLLTRQKLDEVRLEYKKVFAYGTPRRLVIYVQDLEEQARDAVIENRGPKKAIAYDNKGNPTKALLGFARGQKVNVEDLEIRDVEGTEYVFAVRTEKGLKAEKLLPELLPNLVNTISFPKSMRWGYFHTRFARPIRWITALYGSQVVSFMIENISSSNITTGHRFLSPVQLQVNNPEHYFEVINSNYVILDQDFRREMIWKQILEAAAAAGGVPMENDDLLEEITYLVEYPTAFCGSFSPSYLAVPPEVLTTTMIEHQRYFPVFDHQGRLLNSFVGVRNGTSYSLDIVKAGNERVLKARLEDALFFWNEDTKVPLEALVEKLSAVLFHERLGSVLDRVHRLQHLAVYIGNQYKLSSESRLSRAALLCKADLVSNMVYEFTELQGIMGRYYAINSNEDAEVSEAIFEHYLPRFAGDTLPRTETGTVLSLAEKIDSLTGFFAIGIKPSGSQDPYALRRQAMGIVNIILESEIKIDLRDCIDEAYQGFVAASPSLDRDETIQEVMDFILQRMRGLLLDEGFSYDVIDAVMQVPSGDLNNMHKRISVLQSFKHSNYFGDFMVVYNRSHNLSKNWQEGEVAAEYLEDDTEKKLYAAVLEVNAEAVKAADSEDYMYLLKRITDLRSAVDNFFTTVMVMVEDEKLKAARLSLLKSITKLCEITADFSKIVQ